MTYILPTCFRFRPKKITTSHSDKNLRHVRSVTDILQTMHIVRQLAIGNISCRGCLSAKFSLALAADAAVIAAKQLASTFETIHMHKFL